MSSPTASNNMTDEPHLRFEKAVSDDLDAVCILYREAIGTPGCAWNEEYPSRETAREDLAAGGLYVLRMGSRIIGTATLLPENELDGMNCFAIRSGAREFARITVLSEFRRKGYAGYMLGKMTEIAGRTGITAWHILVATGNHPAISLYRSFGFVFHGECEMYGNRYYIAEKAL